MTNGHLRMLAGQLGKEWRELAAALNLRPMRIQAILRQHVNKETNDTRFDMLLTWAKRVPKAVDKVIYKRRVVMNVRFPRLILLVRLCQ